MRLAEQSGARKEAAMSQEVKLWWEDFGPSYQRICQIPIDVHYGPGSPNEEHLQLIGPVAGKRVLEIGCGGAQCGIAFALQGALVTGVDITASQLAFARELAEHHHVTIEFHERSMENLEPIPSGSQDLVFSAFALGYVDDLFSCFREVHRVLKEDGLFVWSDGHPFFLLEGQTLQPCRSYFETGKIVEGGDETGPPSVCFHRTVSDCVNLLTETGFVIERMLEPDSRQQYPYDPWYDRCGYTPELMQLFPPTIIFKCRKRE
jgi:ubiquinone/menaquinone biosynthesis C-methylase UbiE